MSRGGTREMLRAIADEERPVEAWIVYRLPDGSWEWDFVTENVNNLLFELRTAAIQTRAKYGAE